MSESKFAIAVRLDESLVNLIADLAREQRRTPNNFIAQFLRVSLQGNLDRSALNDLMNPSTVEMRPAIEKERARIERLLTERASP